MTADATRLNLADPGQSAVGFVRQEELAAIAANAGDLALWCGRIDLGECHGKQELLTRFADTLHFPASFGGNWDALTDCMRDLAWLPAPGHVLLLEHGERFRRACPEEFDILLDLLEEACDDAARTGNRLFVFIAFRGHTRKQR